MSPLLTTHLGMMYAADVLGQGKMDAATEVLRVMLDSDAGLRSEAVNEMQRLSGIKDGRCFISKKHLEYLKLILN